MKDKLRHRILSDAFGAIAWPTALYLSGDLVEQLVAVYSAGVLASFADSVLSLDVRSGGVSLVKLAVCVALTVLAAPALGLMAENTDLRYALRLDRRMLKRFFSKKYDNALRIDAGEAAQRLENDMIDLRCDLRTVSENIILIPVILASLLYSSLSVSAVMTAAIVAVSLIKLAVPSLTVKMKAKYAGEARDYGAAVRSLEMSVTTRPADARIFGLCGHMLSRLDRLFGGYREKTLKRSIPLNTAADAISEFLDTFCTAALLVSGAVMAASGIITPGGIAAMLGWYRVFGTVFGKVGEIITAVPDINNVAERLRMIYDGEEAAGGSDITGFTDISSAGVRYSYEGSSYALACGPFTVRAGDKTAVTGDNGSGKSTLIMILSGLLQDWSGDLKVNGVSLKDVSPASRRRTAAYAPQQPYLFAGTVRDNIRLGDQSADENRVDEVIERLGLKDIAGRDIGNGDELSGGERQKVSIARALLKHAPLLLLDEPSNNLDAESLDAIIGIIRDYDGTVLFISHLPRLTAAGGEEIRLKAAE